MYDNKCFKNNFNSNIENKNNCFIIQCLFEQITNGNQNVTEKLELFTTNQNHLRQDDAAPMWREKMIDSSKFHPKTKKMIWMRELTQKYQNKMILIESCEPWTNHTRKQKTIKNKSQKAIWLNCVLNGLSKSINMSDLSPNRRLEKTENEIKRQIDENKKQSDHKNMNWKNWIYKTFVCSQDFKIWSFKLFLWNEQTNVKRCDNELFFDVEKNEIWRAVNDVMKNYHHLMIIFKTMNSFRISQLPAKTRRNWVCNSSLTTFKKAREQRDRRDRPSSREKHKKKSKQYNTIDSHRFSVFQIRQYINKSSFKHIIDQSKRFNCIWITVQHFINSVSQVSKKTVFSVFFG